MVKKMKGIIEGRFLIKHNSYIIDLKSVDFITYKENENEIGTYWIKLHIGGKEARYVCYDLTSMRELIGYWTMQQGSKEGLGNEKLM